MSAVEEHKPVEKRRALGRGLDSLLPSGPRIVTAAPAAARTGEAGPDIPPPVVIPPAAPSVAPTLIKAEQAAASSVAPGSTEAEPAEIAEIHAAREKSGSHF